MYIHYMFPVNSWRAHLLLKRIVCVGIEIYTHALTLTLTACGGIKLPICANTGISVYIGRICIIQYV